MKDYNYALVRELGSIILKERYSPWSIANLAGVDVCKVVRICRGYEIGSTLPMLQRIKWVLQHQRDQIEKTMINYRITDLGSSVVFELPMATTALSEKVEEIRNMTIPFSVSELGLRVRRLRDELSLSDVSSLCYVCNAGIISKLERGLYQDPLCLLSNLLIGWEENPVRFFQGDWAPSPWRGKVIGSGALLKRMRRFHKVPIVIGSGLLKLTTPRLSEFESESLETPQELLDRAAEVYGFPSELVKGVSALGAKSLRPASDYLAVWSSWLKCNNKKSGVFPDSTKDLFQEIENRKTGPNKKHSVFEEVDVKPGPISRSDSDAFTPSLVSGQSNFKNMVR